MCKVAFFPGLSQHCICKEQVIYVQWCAEISWIPLMQRSLTFWPACDCHAAMVFEDYMWNHASPSGTKRKRKRKRCSERERKRAFPSIYIIIKNSRHTEYFLLSNSVSSEEPTLVIHKNQLFVGLNLLSSSSETKAKTKIEHSHHQHIIWRFIYCYTKTPNLYSIMIFMPA